MNNDAKMACGPAEHVPTRNAAARLDTAVDLTTVATCTQNSTFPNGMHDDGCHKASWPSRRGDLRCGLDFPEEAKAKWLAYLDEYWCSCGNPSDEHVQTSHRTWACRDCFKLICTG